MCWLLSIEQYHCKKQLPFAAYFEAAGSVSGSAIVHKIRYPGSFQPDLYQRRRRMENRILNKIRALWIPSNAFQIDKRASNISGFYQ